ncbi:DUF4245 domain-containing protein [Glaciihabitans sp. dw_435]|uniref:DUF4245 domain-containing protein n=1 Tax=Glaciihabitans sp. dw_435 TaxID=2720081 RepID=UPI001BD59B95|nr:DUF4245 domain-containing protein [Glaciihabitans sp. dw_435]
MVTEPTSRPKPEPVRADLGRPETPAEKAARKAENSANYRNSKTPNNLVVALVASLAVVLFLVLVVVRPTPSTAPAIDYAAVAAEAQPGVTTTLVVPTLPPGWSANNAELTPDSNGGFNWTIGFLTPKDQFIALEQGIDVSPGWLGSVLGSGDATGTTTIEGINWQVYDRRGSKDPGNYAYSLATTIGGSTYVLHGTAVDGEFAILASAIAGEVQE